MHGINPWFKHRASGYEYEWVNHGVHKIVRLSDGQTMLLSNDLKDGWLKNAHFIHPDTGGMLAHFRTVLETLESPLSIVLGLGATVEEMIRANIMFANDASNVPLGYDEDPWHSYAKNVVDSMRQNGILTRHEHATALSFYWQLVSEVE